MKTPYQSLPAYTRWSKAVAGPDYASVDPVASFPFKIGSNDKVATAGSCFAQHIARHLKKSGFNYFVAEPGHPLGDATAKAEFSYGTFSARYGNIYTAAQLLQIALRATGDFKPQESIWTLPGGGLADPFRPAIQPMGFASEAELIADRAQHLQAVRKMFCDLDIFVFTLGLTEAWRSRVDGAVLPVCPGVNGGTYAEDRYEFVNYRIHDVIADMRRFITILRELNSNARIILTVSPVPLVATAENRHVLVSTTYSKSALRTACEELTQEFSHVAYFPSYEVITGAYTRGRYFAEDLRSVTEEGVEHVMRLFLAHATDGSARVVRPRQVDKGDFFLEKMSNVVRTTCEEELIEASLC